MEEKYSQIKMDIGTPEENHSAETQKDDDIKEESAAKSQKKSVHISEPETLSISEDMLINTEEADDDVPLISPNEEIFNLVTEKLKNAEIDTDTTVSEYTDAFKKVKKDKEVKFDDTYASTSNADKQFMHAFGIGEHMDTIDISEKGTQQTTEIDTMQGDIHSDYYEYTNRQQRKEIIGMYKYAKKSIKTKTIIASVFALLLLFVENIGIFGNNIGGILNIELHPYLHFFTNFVFFALCASCAYEQLYHGARSIISKEYIPESVAVIAVAIGLIHSVAMLICIPFGYAPRLYNFPIAFICLASLVFSYINVAREKFGFSVVSSKDEKFVLRRDNEHTSEDEQDTFTDSTGGVIGNIARIEECSFVKNYFANTNSGVKLRGYFNIYFKVVLIVPVIFAIISLFRHFSLPQAIAIWNLGIVLALPAGVLFMYSVPFFIGNKHLFDDQVSIIGEKAVDEYSDIDIVTVNDTTAFPPYNVKLQGLNVYNDYKIEKVLYYAVSGFSVVGGPLAEVFEVATKDAFQKSRRTKFICSGRSYLCVKVDNDVIIFADRYGMMSQGIDVGGDKEENADCNIMYIACNTKLCARMYLKYKIDDEFFKIVKSLMKCGVGVGVRTFDPNINNDLISAQTKLRKKDLRVIRLTSSEEIVTPSEKLDSPIVSKGLSKSLLKAIPVCKRIVSIRKVGKVLKILASAIGIAFMGLIVFGGFKFLPSVAVLGYYAAVMLIMSCITFMLMPSRSK